MGRFAYQAQEAHKLQSESLQTLKKAEQDLLHQLRNAESSSGLSRVRQQLIAALGDMACRPTARVVGVAARSGRTF